MTHRLARLLSPRSVAVIGGGDWCEAVIEQNLKTGLQRPIWPVHPTRTEICEQPVFRNLDSLPGTPDAVFIGVNRHATVEIVGRLSSLGAGGAVCFASGFREREDGRSLERALLQAAGNMPILGPNCYGFVNYLDNALLWPDQHGGLPIERGVAIIAQSSNIAINLTMQRRGLPLAYMVTAGNQAQTGVAEIGSALLEDKRVTALGLHIEGVSDLRSYEHMAATAEALGKSIVVLKVGTSEAGRTAAMTHTAALSGSQAGSSALFRRLGFAQAHSPAHFLETLKLLHVTGPLDGNGIASMSCSGGEAGLIADTAERFGLEFPALSHHQQQRLSKILGPLVSPTNPLDYHTHIWGDRAALAQMVEIMLETHVALTLLLLDFPRRDRCSTDSWAPVIDACLAVRENVCGNLAVVSTLVENMPEEEATRLLRHGIVPLCGLDDACAAVSAASTCGRRRTVEPLLLAKEPPSSIPWDEATAKAAIARHGVRIPEARIAESVSSAAKCAQAIGFPVVLKGRGHAHKTENDAVRLDLRTISAVREAATSMRSKDFLVEEMIGDGIVELLVGIHRDPAHGFVLTLAGGGVFTELMKDQQSLLVPAEPEAVADALEKLRMAPILAGYRGGPAVDSSEIIKAVMALQDYVINNAEELHAVEINPLICGPTRAVAADVLIIRKAEHD